MSHEAKIFLIDDDVFVQKHMTMLARQMGVECRACLTAEQFLAEYQGEHPVCVVSEFRLLGMDGNKLQETLVADGVQLPFIFLSGHADISSTVRAMRHGALTVLEKPCSEHTLVREVHAALLQDDKATQVEQQHAKARERIGQLTAKECQVLDLMMEGKPNKVIAKRLGVSLRTVEVRRQHIFQKMHTRSVAELVRLVLSSQGSSADVLQLRES
jgi:FixJ family two-component response regulator